MIRLCRPLADIVHDGCCWPSVLLAPYRARDADGGNAQERERHRFWYWRRRTGVVGARLVVGEGALAVAGSKVDVPEVGGSDVRGTPRECVIEPVINGAVGAHADLHRVFAGGAISEPLPAVCVCVHVPPVQPILLIGWIRGRVPRPELEPGGIRAAFLLNPHLGSLGAWSIVDEADLDPWRQRASEGCWSVVVGSSVAVA